MQIRPKPPAAKGGRKGGGDSVGRSYGADGGDFSATPAIVDGVMYLLTPRLKLRALDAATGTFLDENRSPSRKAGELDNRGSHFYLALYWAQELARQSTDADLAARFAPLAEALAANEAKIVDELNAVQGEPADIGGYYQPDPERASAAMRPSTTFNDILATLA